MVNTKSKSKMSVALVLVMAGAVSANLVPYTLGGTTIMIDSSVLGYNSPLLMHLREGMPLRRNTDEPADSTEAGDATGDDQETNTASMLPEPTSEALLEDATGDNQAPHIFTQQYGFVKDGSGNLDIDVYPTSHNWDWENQEVLPSAHGSLYYAVQTPDVAHVSQKIHNIVTSLNQNNAGAKLNDRAPVDDTAFPIMPARPGDVPPVLSESGFAGVSVMHKVPQDTEPYDESTTNTGNFNIYLDNDPNESVTTQGGSYQHEDQILFESAFPSLNSWVNVDHRIPQEDPSAHVATGLELGSPHAAPLAPSDLHHPGHDSSGDQEQIAEHAGDPFISLFADGSEDDQEANVKQDASLVTSTTQVSDASPDATQTTEDTVAVTNAAQATGVRQDANPTSDTTSDSQNKDATTTVTEAATESTSASQGTGIRQGVTQTSEAAQTTIQSAGSLNDTSSQHADKDTDAQIEASVVNPTQESAQDGEPTENPQNRGDEFGDEFSTTIPVVLETTEMPSEGNTTVPVDEILTQKEEDFRLKEEQEKQAMLAEEQAQFALEQAMADLFSNFASDENTSLPESGADRADGDTTNSNADPEGIKDLEFITTTEAVSSNPQDDSDRRADSQLPEAQTDNPEIYQTTTEYRQSDVTQETQVDDEQNIQTTKIDEQSTNSQETHVDDRVGVTVHEPSDNHQNTQKDEQVDAALETLVDQQPDSSQEKQEDDQVVTTHEAGDIQEIQSDDQLATIQEPQADTSQQTHTDDHLNTHPTNFGNDQLDSTQGTLEIRPLPSPSAKPVPAVPIPYAENPPILSDFPPTREAPASSQSSLHYSPAANINPRPITLSQADGVYVNGVKVFNQRHNPPGPETSLISWYDRDPITIFDPHHHVSKVTESPVRVGDDNPQDNDIQTGGGGIPNHQPPKNDDDIFPEEDANSTVSLVLNGAVFHTAHPTLIQKSTCKCGLRFNKKIVGGKPSDIAQYPWQIGLARKYDNFVFCGGSIISDQYILTAAHCVDQNLPENLVVRVGETSRSGPAMTIDVKQIIVHERYTYESIVAYDIALLKLAWPIEFSESVLPVCLPDNKKTFNKKKAIVTGWGKDDASGSVLETLHEVSVKVYSTRKCKKQSLYKDDEIHKNIVCAASNNRDACQGDSGGPLVVLEGVFYKQIGVVSWGIGCAEKDYPGIYTRVSSYRKWIYDNTKDAVHCKAPATKSKNKNKGNKKNKKNKNRKRNKNKKNEDKNNEGENEGENENENNNRKRNKPGLAGQILKITNDDQETNTRKENKNKNTNKNESGGEDKGWHSLTQALKGIAEIIREETDTPTPEQTAEE
ncbi:uncharacterized protein LOC122253260 isoform X2 [Penaeus japonicus]|uniref:uncharacterized protein LOC122253260 isoform X2 n=1 Tax=Penaeus japonicus TaxID=27405 RepID=UPI001C7115E8|nr:uncharacterized protein LOC122253260 isoform X2 [Penaeus japonicus]